jgi:hypothetical protein
MRRRARRRNPGVLGDTLFQITVGVVTAIVATVILDRMRESRNSSVLPHAPVDGWDIA